MNNSLSPRLSIIASKVPKGARVADVGSDHAYIPIHLIKNGIASSAIASDIKAGPIKRARENIKRQRFSEKIKTFLSDGLKEVPPNLYDTVIIAGMGGILISKIIESAKFNKDTLFILQPMTAVDKLRLYLYSNGFEIQDEELVAEENKIYNVLVARLGQFTSFEEIDLYIGRELVLKADPLLPLLIKRQIKNLRTKLSGLEKGGYFHGESAERCRKLLAELYEYQIH